MAINYAQKYSAQVDERFKLSAVSHPAVNQDYDFTGVKTVNVYSIPTVAMENYTRDGANRYGTPTELQDSLQEMTMTQDRAFTFTVDRGNNMDQMGVKAVGTALQRQIDEVIVPELDIYRLGVICANAGTTSAVTPIDRTNAYEMFLDGTMALTEVKAPAGGRIAYVSPSYYKYIKLDDSFIQASEVAQGMLLRGQIGMVDGIPLIVVPSAYLPTGVEFLITNPIAACGPVKLQDYKIHDNPPGINGWLVEGRVYYDTFVLNNKKNAIYVHKGA